MKTFEMVLGGHPDKVCDIIAERIKNKVNGKVVSAKELYEYDLEFYEFILGDLLLGKEIELDGFVSENSFDILQLVELENENNR